MLPLDCGFLRVPLDVQIGFLRAELREQRELLGMPRLQPYARLFDLRQFAAGISERRRGTGRGVGLRKLS